MGGCLRAGRVGVIVPSLGGMRRLNQRFLKYVVAYHGFHVKTLASVVAELGAKNVYVLSSKDMFDYILEYSRQPNIKIQDQMLRVIQLINSAKI
jgi:hypothetical protein